MHREGEEIHITTDEARGGETGTGLRYMLGFGLALVIVALSAVWITGALSSEKHTPQNATTVDRPLAPDEPLPDSKR